MGIDFTFLPQYHQPQAHQVGTPFTETGESGNLVVVAATGSGAKASTEASTEGTMWAGSRRNLEI